MCVQRGLYPLVELEDKKRKVLLNYGVAIENRDFTPINNYILEWNKSILGISNFSSFNSASKQYGIKKFVKYVSIPCGHCEECNKSKARGWAYRILEEAKKYDNNFFITFTYDDKFLPLVKNDYGIMNTLVKDAISKFNKKLKTQLSRKGFHSDFRFYGVGEYGSKTLRPHYHVIYFNLDIPDLVFNYYKDGYLHFKSQFLQDAWSKEVEDPLTKKKKLEPIGMVDIGAVDIGSACYVARYCDKKQDRDQHQKLVLANQNIVSEFSVMSRRPGIGSDALDKVLDNIKNGIYKLSSNGNDFAIPIYYSRKVKEILKDTDILNEYESRCDFLIKNKINRDLLMSDILGEKNLQIYLLEEDKYKKSLKKQRLDL